MTCHLRATVRTLLLYCAVISNCTRTGTASPSEITTAAPVFEREKLPSSPRPTMRIAEAEPGGLEAKCRRESLRRCLQAKAYPDEPLEWELTVHPMCEGRDCQPGTAEPALVAVVSTLLVHAAHDLYISKRSAVVVQLSYDDVLAAALLDDVTAVDVHCRSKSGFCACADLPADRCDEHAFCWQVRGRAFGDACLSPDPQPVGCSGDEVVESTETDAIAPDGRRWRLPSTSMPTAPGWRRAADRFELPSCNG